MYICIILGLAGCNSVPSNLFILEGSVEGAKDSENIILYYHSLKNGEWYEMVDTTKIINGNFLFQGNIDGLTAAELCFDDPNVVYSARIYLEPTIMKIQINKKQPYAYKLSGTKVEKENIELRKELEPYEKISQKNRESIDSLITQIRLYDNNPSIRDSLITILYQFKQKILKTSLDFISKHNTYQIAPDLLYLITKSEFIPVDTVKLIYNNLPEQSKNSLMGKFLSKQIEYQESIKDTSVGTIAPDFTRKDFYGKTIRLSDFKDNSFVLLDFWASWCVPCIKEIPKIKSLHNKYSKKEFAIISISLDDDTIKWRDAIDKYKLDTWSQILNIQHETNSVFNKDDICILYNVESGIPYFILIDKQGKIVARWQYLGEKELAEMDKILNYK